MRDQPLGVYYGTDFVRCGRGLTFNGVDLDNTAGECQGAPSGALYVARRLPPAGRRRDYVVGNPEPDWTGAVRTSFRIQKFSIGGLLDIRQGGAAQQRTKGALHHFGTSKESQENRDGGNFVFGDNYFGHETVAGPGAGMAVPIGEAWYHRQRRHLQRPHVAVRGETPASSSSARSRWATPSTSPGSTGCSASAAWSCASRGGICTPGPTTPAWTRRRRCWVRPARSRGIDYFNNPQSRSYVFSLTLNR